MSDMCKCGLAQPPYGRKARIHREDCDENA